MKEENIYELQIGKKVTNNTVSKKLKNKPKQLVTAKEQKILKNQLEIKNGQIAELTEKIREAKNLEADLSRYNLHDSVIRLKLEARLHEHLIMQAQRLMVKPDIRMERELDELREQGAAISQEIFKFLKERDANEWREWEAESDPRILRILRENYRHDGYGTDEG